MTGAPWGCKDYHFHKVKQQLINHFNKENLLINFNILKI
jgi:hypothetical protein